MAILVLSATGSPLAAAGTARGLADLTAEARLEDGRRAVPVFRILAERFLAEEYSPTVVAPRCGLSADTIRRVAAEVERERNKPRAPHG